MKSSINWSTVKRKVKDLVPTPYNPRRLTQKQEADLRASLVMFGLAEIPVINTDNQTLAGHQRVAILLLLGEGETEIDVRIPNRKLEKYECDQYIIRSNKNTGEWNDELLANHFSEDALLQWGFTLADLGMGKDDDESGGEADATMPEIEIGWRDIKSAPKDGTRILVFNVEGNEGQCYFAQWGEGVTVDGEEVDGWFLDDLATRLENVSNWMPEPEKP